VAGPLDAVPEADRPDFEARLANLGLTADAIIAPELVAPRSTVTTLSSSPSVPSQYQPVILRTTDFSQLNQWIGVPDRVFDKVQPIVDAPPVRRLAEIADAISQRPRTSALRASLQSGTATAPISELVSRDLADVRAAARAYLRGDSRHLAQFTGVLQTVFPVIEIPAWLFINIVVKSGSVLEFGPGQNALVAYSVTVEEGGVIRSYGNLDVSATILRKSTGMVIHTIDEALLVGRRFGPAVFEG
jgi:hypothetical protein